MNKDMLAPESWRAIMDSAYSLFQDAEERGFGTPPFSLGGGTVLMFEFKHRLSRDIDLFGHDAHWISILSPRLNEHAALFGDCSFETLDQLGAEHGVACATIRRACAHARAI